MTAIVTFLRLHIYFKNGSSTTFSQTHPTGFRAAEFSRKKRNAQLRPVLPLVDVTMISRWNNRKRLTQHNLSPHSTAHKTPFAVINHEQCTHNEWTSLFKHSSYCKQSVGFLRREPHDKRDFTESVHFAERAKNRHFICASPRWRPFVVNLWHEAKLNNFENSSISRKTDWYVSRLAENLR